MTSNNRELTDKDISQLEEFLPRYKRRQLHEEVDAWLADKVADMLEERKEMQGEIEHWKEECRAFFRERLELKRELDMWRTANEENAKTIEELRKVLEPFAAGVVYDALKYYDKQGLCEREEWDDLNAAREAVGRASELLEEEKQQEKTGGTLEVLAIQTTEGHKLFPATEETLAKIIEELTCDPTYEIVCVLEDKVEMKREEVLKLIGKNK